MQGTYSRGAGRAKLSTRCVSPLQGSVQQQVLPVCIIMSPYAHLMMEMQHYPLVTHGETETQKWPETTQGSKPRFGCLFSQSARKQVQYKNITKDSVSGSAEL